MLNLNYDLSKNSNYHRIQNNGKVLALLVDSQKQISVSNSVVIRVYNFLTRKLDSEIILPLPEGKLPQGSNFKTEDITKGFLTQTGFIILYFQKIKKILFTHDFENFQYFEEISVNLNFIDEIFINSTNTCLFLAQRKGGMEVYDICCRKLFYDNYQLYNFDCNQSKILSTSRLLLSNFKNQINPTTLMICIDFSMFNADTFGSGSGSSGGTNRTAIIKDPKIYSKSNANLTNSIKLTATAQGILNNWLFSLKTNQHYLMGLRKLSSLNLLENNSLIDILIKIIENSQDLTDKNKPENAHLLKDFNDIIENINLQDLKNIKIDLLTVDCQKTRDIVVKRCVKDSKFKYENSIDVEKFINEGRMAGKMALKADSGAFAAISQVVNREFE